MISFLIAGNMRKKRTFISVLAQEKKGIFRKKGESVEALYLNGHLIQEFSERVVWPVLRENDPAFCLENVLQYLR